MNEKSPVSKHERMLEIYSRLQSGEMVCKQKLANEFGVSPRSIQRDIDSIRDFCSNQTVYGYGVAEVKYDRCAGGFRLVDSKTVTLTSAQLYTVAKILLESRSLSTAEMQKIIAGLLGSCLSDEERKKMSDLLKNELFHYVEPRHGKQLIRDIWELASAIYQHRTIRLEYHKVNGEITIAPVKPVGILCADFYFYLLGFIGNKDQKYPGYPTVYRIDRIHSYKITQETFRVPYKDRFEEGQFRKKVPFMFTGKLQKTSFIYQGLDINTVLDRLPTAQVEPREDGTYLVTAEVYGTRGLEMWLQSLGEDVLPV